MGVGADSVAKLCLVHRWPIGIHGQYVALLVIYNHICLHNYLFSSV
jgi:hypothetical protein